MSLRVTTFAVFGLFAGCIAPEADLPTDTTESVWAVDLITLLPGGREEYTGNIKNNWAQARDIALRDGNIVSFQAMITEPDSTREWDIILMTEYTDSVHWGNREAIFSQIFESAEFTRVPTERPSSELRSFVEGGVVLKSIVSSAHQ